VLIVFSGVGSAPVLNEGARKVLINRDSQFLKIIAHLRRVLGLDTNDSLVSEQERKVAQRCKLWGSPSPTPTPLPFSHLSYPIFHPSVHLRQGLVHTQPPRARGRPCRQFQRRRRPCTAKGPPCPLLINPGLGLNILNYLFILNLYVST
jgi:hypothetical protein